MHSLPFCFDAEDDESIPREVLSCYLHQIKIFLVDMVSLPIGEGGPEPLAERKGLYTKSEGRRPPPLDMVYFVDILISPSSTETITVIFSSFFDMSSLAILLSRA